MAWFSNSFRRAAVLIGLALLAACADEPQLQPLFAGDRIVAFGDSLTYGTGTRPQYSYPAILAQLTGLEVINAGVPGEDTTQGLVRLRQLLVQDVPNLVILCHGGNDFLRRRPSDVAQRNLASMVAEIQASGAQVLLIAVPRPGLFLSAEPLYQELVDQFGIPAEMDILADLEGEAALKADAVHFNREGYRRLASAIYARLQETGAL